jgi:hypothetical protein
MNSNDLEVNSGAERLRMFLAPKHKNRPSKWWRLFYAGFPVSVGGYRKSAVRDGMASPFKKTSFVPDTLSEFPLLHGNAVHAPLPVHARISTHH